MQQPTLEEWRSLYAVANEIKKMKPWEWMCDCDIFGVQDPETGTTYYCVIMGSGGIHFGLSAYRGAHGLSVLLETIEDNDDPGAASDLIYETNCLQCSFEDRDMLAKEDLAVIKNLGLKYRGRNQWPSFRDYSPGLFPWFIDRSQCKMLTLILTQALEVMLLCRDDISVLEGKNGEYLVRRLKASDNGQSCWENAYLMPPRFEIEIAQYTLQDKVLAKKLQKIKTDNRLEFEVDIFYAPTPVGDKQHRPYFPKLCAIMERKQGTVLSFEIAQESKQAGFAFLDSLATLLLEMNKKPRCIYIEKQETLNVFEDFCNQVGIRLETVPILPSIHALREDMLDGF